MSIELKAPVMFEHSEFYERIIQLRVTDRKTFDSLSTPTHYALIAYERAKREAAITEEARAGVS